MPAPIAAELLEPELLLGVAVPLPLPGAGTNGAAEVRLVKSAVFAEGACIHMAQFRL